MTVRLPSWFGKVVLEGNQINNFREKPESGERWINRVIFRLHPKVIEYTDGDGTAWAKKPLERLTREGHK
jgi:glucose-1-phosphate cytidylyltransferase